MGLNSKITQEDFNFMIKLLELEGKKWTAEGAPIMSRSGEANPLPEEMEIYLASLVEEFLEGLRERHRIVCQKMPMSLNDYMFVSLASLIENVMHVGIAMGENRNRFTYGINKQLEDTHYDC
jgi:hypothetical protein